MVLGISQRQTRRLPVAYRKKGAAAVAHGNRGRRPANALPGEAVEQIMELARSKYVGFNTQQSTEMLIQRESIKLSSSKVRRRH